MVFGFSVFTVFVFGSLGVMFSTFIRRTIAAMVTTYGVMLFLVGGNGIFDAHCDKCNTNESNRHTDYEYIRLSILNV